MTAPGQLSPKWRASAALLDDGHVEFSHECSDGTVVGSLPMPPWRVVQAEPLRVEPSVHCTRCGWHGWIDNGVWPDSAEVDR